MVHLPKFFSRRFNKERTISASAKSIIEQIFDDKSEQQGFFDLTLSSFEHYDASNRPQTNEHFLADIEFIIHCTTASLTTPEHVNLFSRRVDAYFYIYQRVLEYLLIAKESPEQMNEFKNQLYLQLALAFDSTEGREPNLYVSDQNLVKKLNIQQHLASMKSISDIKMLSLFFVLCKLSLQSSFKVDGNNHIQWINIFERTSIYHMSIRDIIQQYIQKKEAFKQFPLDIPTFIYLFRKIGIPNAHRQLPIEFFIEVNKTLGFNHKIFFEQFYPVYNQNLRNQRYDTDSIANLLYFLGNNDEQLFARYATSYSSNGDIDGLWNVILFFMKKDDINQIIQRQFGSVFIQQIQNIPIASFERYFRSVMEFLEPDKAENRPNFLKLIEQIFQSFLHKQLNHEQYFGELDEPKIKYFLSVASKLSLANSLQHLPYIYCLIIRHLLFKFNTNLPRKCDRIASILRRIARFKPAELCQIKEPSNIIRDEWLNDYVFDLPQQWVEMDQHIYSTSLCSGFCNDDWSVYIWSRIIHLSFIKSESSKPNDILQPLSKWMSQVKHDTYDANDTLTIIFVTKIFELVIIKNMKSISSLSNISVIVRYILRLKEEASKFIDKKLVDDFLGNVKRSINDLLLLNGKIND